MVDDLRLLITEAFYYHNHRYLPPTVACIVVLIDTETRLLTNICLRLNNKPASVRQKTLACSPSDFEVVDSDEAPVSVFAATKKIDTILELDRKPKQASPKNGTLTRGNHNQHMRLNSWKPL